MMKKILFLGLVLVPVSLYAAETMEFATVLSSPVGVFSTLEVTNQNEPVTAETIFFGDPFITAPRTGSVFLRGDARPFLGVISFFARTNRTVAMGGDLDEVRVSEGITVKATLKGKQLIANDFTFKYPTKVEVKDTIRTAATLSFRGASIDHLKYGTADNISEATTEGNNPPPQTLPARPYWQQQPDANLFILQSNF